MGTNRNKRNLVGFVSDDHAAFSCFGCQLVFLWLIWVQRRLIVFDGIAVLA